MRGRKPKPTALKVLDGNRGKRKLPQGEPVAARELLESDAPVWLSDGAREIWKRELARAPRGLLGAHHAELFGAYCQALHELSRAAELLSKSAPIVKVGSGDWAQWQVGPAQAAFARHAETVRKLASEFGLTPTSSSRAASGGKEQSGNPFAALARKA